MPLHSPRPTHSALALGLLLAAAVGVSATGMAAAMPADVGSAVGGLSPTTARGPGVVPTGGPLAGPVIGPRSPELPAPSPIALRAEEINRWVDHVVRGGVSVQQDDPWTIIDGCVLADMEGDPNTDADDTPGASIAVAVDGVITYTKGYGHKDASTDTGEVDANTLFRIGSTTKMMTAAAVMQLAEDGAVDLNAPLGDYLPEYRLGHPWDADDLTLDLLMSHQTGLVDQYFTNDVSIPLLQWVAATGSYSLPLYAPPGSFWNYANPNFSLSGAVVERVSAMPYATYMASRVWDPSGMPLTTVDSTEVISTGNFAIGMHNGQPVAPGDFDFPMLAPAGTAYSTPTELATWALQMQSSVDDVLTAASKQAMQARRVSLSYLPWMDYGYGVFVTDWRDIDEPDTRVVVYDHGGNINGGSSQLFWVPERGIVVSVLASTIRSLDGAAACALETLGGIQPIPGDSTRTEPETWDAFTGTYSLMDLLLWPWTGSVTRVTDTLTLDFPDIYGSPMLMGSDMPMYYAYADLFVPLADSMLLGPNSADMSFIRDKDDPSRVRYMRNRNLVGQRVGRFPDRIAIEGESCTDLDVTSELDMPVLQIQETGLVTPTRVVSAPLAADDPNDPSTASTRLDFTVGPSGADMVYARSVTAPDDAVALFLLADLDGDGAFVFENELLAGGYNDYGASLLYTSGPLPAGDYQLWVWGLAVNGAESELSLELTVMQGEHLRLENRPRGLADGAEWTMQVCAKDVADFTEPMTGMVQFSYDSPPRMFRVMVDWSPGSVQPPGAIYMPFANRGPAGP